MRLLRSDPVRRFDQIKRQTGDKQIPLKHMQMEAMGIGRAFDRSNASIINIPVFVAQRTSRRRDKGFGPTKMIKGIVSEQEPWSSESRKNQESESLARMGRHLDVRLFLEI